MTKFGQELDKIWNNNWSKTGLKLEHIKANIQAQMTQREHEDKGIRSTKMLGTTGLSLDLKWEFFERQCWHK